MVLVAAPREYVYAVRSVAEESLRQLRADTAPVNEIVAAKHPVRSGVGEDIHWVWAAVFEAVVGIGLAPATSIRVSGIDVVPKGLFLAPTEVGLLPLKAWITPILLESHRASHPHSINDVLLPSTRLRPRPHDPVTDLSGGSYFRLAGRKRTDTEKRIRRKTIIAGNDIRVQPHAAS
jgi:hypothetical protein